MQYRIFTINAEEPSCDEMNAFLRNKKIAEVEKHFFTMQSSAYWTFCVSYIDDAQNNNQSNKREKVDYKDTLDEKSFERFSMLRELRKTIAASEGLPIYAVFTNDELAGIAQLEHISLNALKSINGLGEKRVEKYGTAIIETLSKTEEQH